MRMNTVPDTHAQLKYTHSTMLCRPYTTACIMLLLCLWGCSPAPAEHRVRDAISAYFQRGDLQVVRLEIRSIEREPIGARQYMGPERFIVNIPVITLQSTKPGGEPVDYENVTITIRENTASLYGVSIDDASIAPWQ